MKTCIIQPAYSVDYSLSEQMFQWELEALEQCDGSLDLIVLPEASDVPCLAHTREEFVNSYNRFGQILLDKCAETARRCQAVVFVNATFVAEKGERNTTYAFDTKGQMVGHYYKKHLTPGEVNKRRLDSEYTFEFSEPTVITIDGVRYGFLTCYDFYFYEAFANIARQNVDVIIGCSHQRSDTHEAIEVMSRFCAYNCNAYMVRASVSMDENSNIGGGSMIIAPDGTILANLKSQVGVAYADINPKEKYFKPAGFGNPDAAHYEYIEAGRRPWNYRPGGSAIARTDQWMPYPRTCAHRGFIGSGPENSLPALAAAVAMGAEEIEFDVWSTADGELVVFHDEHLDRLSNGSGKVWEQTWAELKTLDFGTKAGECFAGMGPARLEDVLKKLSCHAVMNLHLKTPKGSKQPYDEAQLQKLLHLIHKYDCAKHVYIMSGNDTVLRQLRALAPNLILCCGGGDAPEEIVDRAIAIGCRKVQLVKGHFDQSMIRKAHDHGIQCNVFWSDDPQEARLLLQMGVDTILTNAYPKIAAVVKAYRATEERRPYAE